jgi:predicted nucleic acid-binding protein
VSVFLDTSALYALMLRTEDGHEAVVESFRELAGSGRRFVTSNYVLAETTALLQHRIGLDAVRDLGSRVLPLVELRWITPVLHRRALDRLLQADRRHLSLVDCSSFVVMDAEGIRDVLALDEDFGREGYRTFPETG